MKCVCLQYIFMLYVFLQYILMKYVFIEIHESWIFAHALGFKENIMLNLFKCSAQFLAQFFIPNIYTTSKPS